MNLICPICLREYPVKPHNGDIKCPCGGHFSYERLKWTYHKNVRLKELAPVIKMKTYIEEKQESD